MRRYIRKCDLLPPPVAKDNYTKACDRCGAAVGEPCTLQTKGFRQWPNVTGPAAFIPAGAVALRIHYERVVAVREAS